MIRLEKIPGSQRSFHSHYSLRILKEKKEIKLNAFHVPYFGPKFPLTLKLARVSEGRACPVQLVSHMLNSSRKAGVADPSLCCDEL